MGARARIPVCQRGSKGGAMLGWQLQRLAGRADRRFDQQRRRTSRVAAPRWHGSARRRGTRSPARRASTAHRAYAWPTRATRPAATAVPAAAAAPQPHGRGTPAGPTRPTRPAAAPSRAAAAPLPPSPPPHNRGTPGDPKRATHTVAALARVAVALSPPPPPPCAWRACARATSRSRCAPAAAHSTPPTLAE